MRFVNVSIHIEWIVEKRVAYLTSSGVPDMSVFRATQDDLIMLMNEVSAPVHLIFDIRQLEQFPPLIEFIRSPYITHPQRGQIVVIGLKEKPLFRILVNSLVRGLRLNVLSVDSLDEARAALLKADPSLVWD
jgi:hypothetical protein